jgi:alpha-methylacyl-CoA racemase
MFVWGKARGENFLDTGAHFYDTYKTKDGKYLAIGSIEPNFYTALLRGLDMNPGEYFLMQ